MKIKKLLLSILIIAASLNVKAQTSISCDSFCVTGIQSDTATSNTWFVNILMSGSNLDFINYPYVYLVTDLAGDTIATGSMNFFGQIGNTTQPYSVTTVTDSMPVPGSCIVYFTHDTSNCILSFPCGGTGINDNYSIIEPAIFPNPSNGHFFIHMNNMTAMNHEVIIYNILGIPIYSFSKATGESEIDLSNYPKGVYFVESKNESGICTKRIIIQ